MYVAKTKVLISFAVTAKLICVFVFAYAKSRFSHDAAQMVPEASLLGAQHYKASTGFSFLANIASLSSHDLHKKV